MTGLGSAKCNGQNLKLEHSLILWKKVAAGLTIHVAAASGVPIVVLAFRRDGGMEGWRDGGMPQLRPPGVTCHRSHNYITTSHRRDRHQSQRRYPGALIQGIRPHSTFNDIRIF